MKLDASSMASGPYTRRQQRHTSESISRAHFVDVTVAQVHDPLSDKFPHLCRGQRGQILTFKKLHVHSQG